MTNENSVGTRSSSGKETVYASVQSHRSQTVRLALPEALSKLPSAIVGLSPHGFCLKTQYAGKPAQCFQIKSARL